MYCLIETPFRETEARMMLREIDEKHKLEGFEASISRNVICMFREDGAFNFPNIYDIISFTLNQLRFEECHDQEEKSNDYADEEEELSDEDHVFLFLDHLAGCFEENEVGTCKVHGLTSSIVCEIYHNTFGQNLQNCAKLGTHALQHINTRWLPIYREWIFCCVTVVLFQRSLEILHAGALSSAKLDSIYVVEPRLAIFRGQLCSYFGDLEALQRSTLFVSERPLDSHSPHDRFGKEIDFEIEQKQFWETLGISDAN